MLNRHTYLLVGLLVAGGAPYLTRTQEPVFAPGDAEPSAPGISSNTSPFAPAQNSSGTPSAYVRTVAAETKTNSTSETANPFGGATTEQPATRPGGDARSPAPPSRMMLAGGADSVSREGDNKQAGASNAKAAAAADSDRKYPGPSPKNKRIEFSEIFRLDLNSAWLMAHWPRVTTGLTELDWHGYRVSLTTGTQEDDVVGALTFYYDKEQVIQKMTFRGLTGDPRKLVWFATSTYEFEREVVSDPAVQVYRKRQGRKPSELIVRPATVIRADAPHERFEIEFVLYR